MAISTYPNGRPSRAEITEADADYYGSRACGDMEGWRQEHTARVWSAIQAVLMLPVAYVAGYRSENDWGAPPMKAFKGCTQDVHTWHDYGEGCDEESDEP